MISLAMFFVPMQASITMFVFIFVIGVLHQLVTPIQWVMMSDTVDYGEWCGMGKCLTGISFAGTLFVLKLGSAFGGALIGWMLAYGGYDAASAEQRHDQHHYCAIHDCSGDLLFAERDCR